MAKHDVFLADCPARTTLGLVADTWSVVVVFGLGRGPQRYSDLRDRIGRISNKDADPDPAQAGTQQAGGASHAAHGARRGGVPADSARREPARAGVGAGPVGRAARRR